MERTEWVSNTVLRISFFAFILRVCEDIPNAIIGKFARSHFGSTNSEIGFLFSALAGSVICGTVMSGQIVKRWKWWSYDKVLTFMFITQFIASLLFVFSSSWVYLVIGRALVGVFGSIFAASLSLIGIVTKYETDEAITYHTSTARIGMASGNGFSSVLAGCLYMADTRAPFWFIFGTIFVFGCAASVLLFGLYDKFLNLSASLSVLESDDIQPFEVEEEDERHVISRISLRKMLNVTCVLLCGGLNIGGMHTVIAFYALYMSESFEQVIVLSTLQLALQLFSSLAGSRATPFASQIFGLENALVMSCAMQVLVLTFMEAFEHPLLNWFYFPIVGFFRGMQLVFVPRLLFSFATNESEVITFTSAFGMVSNGFVALCPLVFGVQTLPLFGFSAMVQAVSTLFAISLLLDRAWENFLVNKLE